MLRTLALAALTWSACSGEVEVDPALQPHVVVFLADDLGYGDVGFTGGEIATPTLDALAADGLVLERCYTYPLCSPSRYALLTGRTPLRDGFVYAPVARWDEAAIEAGITTLPEALRAAGYQTWMTGKWHLGHRSLAACPNAQGFDHFYGALGGFVSHYDRKTRFGAHNWQRNGTSVHEEGYTTDLIVAEVERLVAERDRERPIFLYVPFTVPHLPVEPPPGFDEEAAKRRQPHRTRYASMVTHMGAAVGRILDAVSIGLDRRGRVAVFSSDHGNSNLEWGDNGKFRGGKANCHEGGIRVPTLVHGAEANGVFDGPVTFMDLYATLLGFADAPLPASAVDALDVAPYLSGATPLPERTLYFATTYKDLKMFAAIEGPWKIVQHGDVWELFDITKDPVESENFIKTLPERRKAMIAGLLAWKELHPAESQVGQPRPERWKNPDDLAELSRP